MYRLKVSLVFVFWALLNLYVDHCTACNGYKMKLISVTNCGDDNVIIVDKNFTASLSSDCIVTTGGCVTSKGFKEAKVKYSILKNGQEMLSGHPDICDVLDHKTAEQKVKLEMFGFPTECPVPEGRKCMDGTKKVDVSKYKNMLPMAVGKITSHYEVTHDSGTTCIEIKFEINK
ncbi:uncharacterized protein LOC116340880 [Contarinia nasturtii]|uniref:uncharacterized protein LOC116340880 n=1 Tax=Contarinia nasturtii TaxID=265458 RepID=UPI0012D409BC|nr:uncharacterized protein LOC116340880 [Contarinia nasturtii]